MHYSKWAPTRIELGSSITIALFTIKLWELSLGIIQILFKNKAFYQKMPKLSAIFFEKCLKIKKHLN